MPQYLASLFKLLINAVPKIFSKLQTIAIDLSCPLELDPIAEYTTCLSHKRRINQASSDLKASSLLASFLSDGKFSTFH